MDSKNLEEAFDKAVHDEVYRKAGKKLGYWAKRFKQQLNRKGGLATAKSKLQTVATAGFLKLVESGKEGLNCSLEALVIRDPWNQLFEESELEVARERLAKYGYFIDTNDSKFFEDHFDELETESFTEGNKKEISFNRHERNKKARDACVEYHGASCCVCNFNFETIYGDSYKGFIHVHHLVELSSIKDTYEVNPINDLRPVCPNCHAIIHSRVPCFSIEEARQKTPKELKSFFEVRLKNYPTPNQTQNPQETLPLAIHPS